VAGLLGVGWDLVKGVYKEHLRRRLKKRRLRKIRRIGVDEFAVHKGHKYMTVVLDLDTGEIVHAQEGKDGAALMPFLRRLRRARVRLEAVAIDMSAAYLNAIRTVFGDRVAVVHDRYHVVALANKAVDQTRRDLVRELSGDEKSALKGTRFLWLRAAENLKEDSLTRLMSMMTAHEPLFEAWLLKELLRDFWEFHDPVVGELFLDEWLELARATENKHLVRLAATLENHRAGLLAYFEHRITSAQVEGTNNKIKVLKRQGSRRC
jgi:transposase